MNKKILKAIKKEMKYLKYCIRYEIFRRKKPIIKIHTIEETIDEIIKNKRSIARFGDGEFLWILDIKQDSFQDQNENLRLDLIRVLTSNNNNCLIGITSQINSVRGLTKSAKIFWKKNSVKIGPRIKEYLCPDKEYFNANISRFYMDSKDKNLSARRFNLLKQIWYRKKLLIVEGEQTRLGVGNDLFDECISIRRIIAPSTNAYDKYKDIYDATLRFVYNDEIVLLALGPTATILAYDLSLLNIQAIDIGHVDIEYEWFKLGVTEKVPIKGKYVNEGGEEGRNVEKTINDKKYLSQIIAKI